MISDWSLSDYAVGTSYDEIEDQKEQDRKAAMAKAKETDFSDFEDGAAMAIPRHADFDVEHVEDSDFPMPIDVGGVDLMSPPGFVGDVTDWIDGQCRYPRRRLCVAAALSAIGNIGGMSHYDLHGGVTANLMTFCVAASSTGKEAVMQAFNELHVSAGIHGALQGTIKSEQEVTRNLIEHQASFYSIDEIGIFLGKVKSAQKRGGATYLEGVFGTIMSAYSKANGRMLLGGDVGRDLTKAYTAALSRAKENDDQEAEASALRMLGMIKRGLERPFMSIVGFTTPSTFDGMMDGETASQGFLGRALIVSERDINPRPRRAFKAVDMPITMAGRLSLLYGGDPEADRVEHAGPRRDIKTTDEAADALHAMADWWIEYADFIGEKMGEAAVAMIRRCIEGVSKISFILSLDSGVRTIEHVRWAAAFVKDEIDYKTSLVFANDNRTEKPEDALTARLMGFIDAENGLTAAMLASKLRVGIEAINEICARLEAAKLIEAKPGRKYRGKVVMRWFRAD